MKFEKLKEKKKKKKKWKTWSLEGNMTFPWNKKFLNCTSRTTFLEVIIFSRVYSTFGDKLKCSSTHYENIYNIKVLVCQITR